MNKDDFLQKYALDTERQREDDITFADAAERWGLSISQATRRLDKLAKDGILEKHIGRMLNGKTGCFYRIVV
jgi:DNA-binding Lrp family transcriptional regulator